MKEANKILTDYGTTIFTVMSSLAFKHEAINLGQGFPDTDGPSELITEAMQATKTYSNQYPPMMGIPELRQAAAEHSKIFYDIDLDWESQTIITSGATEAIASCLFGIIEPGDEVVLIEPLYDCYLPLIRRAGAIPKLVRIAPPKWELPYDDLEAVFSEKTKLILLNTPTNPAAKVYTVDELKFIARLVKKYDSYAVCDEVYEHIVYDGRQHVPLITLSGMADRCIRISSAGKTFSMTGWKVGYSVGAAKLIDAASKAHQFLTFATPPNLQKAVAFGLKKDLSYFAELRIDMEAKRDRLSKGLTSIGFEVMESQGTYFLAVDFRPLGVNLDDVEFCKELTVNAGVAAVPFSAFYKAGLDNGVNHFLRFCYCKEDHVIDEALERLRKYFN
ncbi:MAG: aminotransferase [Pseudomonadota bacterium]|nr:aminotransferase [Pseudomonadota bacterium]